jgi:hypothetical protein
MSIVQDPLILARLSIQRALLGEVSEELRAVVLSVKGNVVDINFYFDGSINEMDAESVSCVEAEVIADFEVEFVVSARPIRLDFPSEIIDEGVWVYKRREIVGG